MATTTKLFDNVGRWLFETSANITPDDLSATKLGFEVTDLKSAILTGILSLLCSMPLLAQEKSDEASAPDAETEQNLSLDGATQRENPSSRVPYESGRVGESTCEDRWSNFLPILGQAACELGYVLPRPFGVSAGYMHQDQPFDVGDIFINGIDVKTHSC